MPVSAKEVARLRAEITNVKRDLAKTNYILHGLLQHLKLIKGPTNEDKPVENPSSPESSSVQPQEAGSDAGSDGHGKQGVLDFASGGGNQDGTGVPKE